MSSSKTATKSFPILGILGLIFVTLKLAEIGTVATWSWWWVLSPFWVPFAIVGAFYGFALLMFCVTLLLKIK
jgi:small Trp-rich protein